jgi:VWFA-related protein
MRSWTTRLIGCVAGALAAAEILVGAQQQPARFRVAVDLIHVDVQVIDRTGQPVAGLTASDFEVTINGRRRKVVSADLVDYASNAPPAPASPTTSPDGAPVAAARSARMPGRIFVLAVDANSFEPGRARPLLDAAADFVRKLTPDDEVGLFTFPEGPIVDVTTEHDAVIRSLEKIVTRLEAPPAGEFRLGIGELVDLARRHAMDIVDMADGDPVLDVAQHYCPRSLGDEYPSCLRRLEREVDGQVLVYEVAAQVTSGHLRELMAGLSRSPRRKTLVLVSGGLVSSTDPLGRPDNNRFGLEVGRAAAEANVNVYALFQDPSRERGLSAENSRGPSTVRPAFDSQLRSGWLDNLAGSAGGSLLSIAAGDGEPAFRQMLRETSAFYLLGVEPSLEDRDGRLHELRVTVRQKGVSVRGRSWVMLPKPGAAPPDLVGRVAEPPARAADTPAPPRAVPIATPAPLPPPPPVLLSLADAFMRDDQSTIAKVVTGEEGTTLLQAFRSSASPWPDAPRRTAAFALDLAAAGMHADWPFTRQEAMRVLLASMLRIRQNEGPRDFECAWLWTASAYLEGQFQPDVAAVVVDRAAERCPADANIRLAQAVVRDQALMASAGLRGTPTASPVSAAEARVLDLYRAAGESGEVREEATIRSAALHWRAGRADAALALLEAVPVTSGDRQLVYVHNLMRGQIDAALGRTDAAAAAFRAAANEFPGAFSALVGLMTSAVRRGDNTQAADLAARALAADRPSDPWWSFAFGDYRVYEGLRARLRQLAE